MKKSELTKLIREYIQELKEAEGVVYDIYVYIPLRIDLQNTDYRKFEKDIISGFKTITDLSYVENDPYQVTNVKGLSGTHMKHIGVSKPTKDVKHVVSKMEMIVKSVMKKYGVSAKYKFEPRERKAKTLTIGY